MGQIYHYCLLSLFHFHFVMCGKIHPSLKQAITTGKEREDKGSGDEFHNWILHHKQEI